MVNLKFATHVKVIKKQYRIYQNIKTLISSRFQDDKNTIGYEKIKKNTSLMENNDWSLTPGRYVGVEQVVDDDFEFEGRLKEIQIELDGLNEEAFELAKIIKSNFEELGI